MTAVLVLLGLALLLGVAVAVSYNRFVSQRALIRSSWSNVETELRRRYDLVPNLVQTVKGYAAHEREVLQAVTEARARAAATTGSPAEQARAEGPLVGALRQLFAVSEAYPALQASANFLELQEELGNTEDRIQASRRFYNANVQDYNRRVRSVPSNLVARQLDFQEGGVLRDRAGAVGGGLPGAGGLLRRPRRPPHLVTPLAGG